jgi:acyl-coenzyme A synthetase/AMP-(fatty) acid ligase
MLGVLRAGGIFSPLNPGCTVGGIVNRLNDTRPRAIDTHFQFLETVEKPVSVAKMDNTIIMLLGDRRDLTGQVPHSTSVRNSSNNT